MTEQQPTERDKAPAGDYMVQQLWDAFDAPATTFSKSVAWDAVRLEIAARVTAGDLAVMGLADAIVRRGYAIERKINFGPVGYRG